MAHLSLPLNHDVIAPRPFFDRHADLAESLSCSLREHHPLLVETVRFDEPSPVNALSLTQWSQPETLSTLMSTYSRHIYAHHPEQQLEAKPIKSLWAQWYIGLLTPALMAVTLTHPQALRLSLNAIQVRFHETGRAETFWIDVSTPSPLAQHRLRERMEYLVSEGLMPVVKALEESGDINAKLIWSNTGYLINWFLGELKPHLGEEAWHALRQACFFEKNHLDGRDNPLFRTVVPREGLLVRRTCCQRNRLPGVQQCGDCTLK